MSLVPDKFRAVPRGSLQDLGKMPRDEEEFFFDEPTDQVSLSDTIHWLARFMGGTGWLLINPLFLKLFTRSRVRIYLNPERAFMAGVYSSLAINGLLALFLVWSSPTAMAFGGIPLLLVLGVVAVRLAVVTLIFVPKSIADEVDRGVMHSVFTTPLSDAEIYFGASSAYLVRGLAVFEETVSFVLGYSIPYIVLNIGTILRAAFGWDKGSIATAGIIVVLLVSIPLLFLVSMLAARAAGLYSVVCSRVGTGFAALGHTAFFLILGFGFWFLWAYVMRLLPGPLVTHDFPLLDLLSFLGLGLLFGVLWYANMYTARLGVWAVGVARRSGVI